MNIAKKKAFCIFENLKEVKTLVVHNSKKTGENDWIIPLKGKEKHLEQS